MSNNGLVKIFTGSSLSRLEAKVNEFLANADVEVLGMDFEVGESFSTTTYYVLVWYMPKE